MASFFSLFLTYYFTPKTAFCQRLGNTLQNSPILCPDSMFHAKKNLPRHFPPGLFALTAGYSIKSTSSRLSYILQSYSAVFYGQDAEIE